MALLELQNVSKSYTSGYATGEDRVMVLDGVSLQAARNEFIAVMGPSGGGKSTLLNLCGAMDFPTAGTVRIDGQETSQLDDKALTRLRRAKVGFIFQSFQLLHTLTAEENVELPLLLGRRTDASARSRERLQWVGLSGFGHRYPHQLSGGQQQRVAIARALSADPALLLADEPTGNLDSSTGEMVLDLLARSAREFGVTVLMATHSLESAAIAHRVLHLRDGRLTTSKLQETH